MELKNESSPPQNGELVEEAVPDPVFKEPPAPPGVGKPPDYVLKETPIPKVSFDCEDCGKKCKTQGGLTRHKNTACKKNSQAKLKDVPIEKTIVAEAEAIDIEQPSSPIQVKITKTKRKAKKPKKPIHIKREVVYENSSSEELTDSDEDDYLIKKIYQEYEREKELRRKIRRDKKKKVAVHGEEQSRTAITRERHSSIKKPRFI